VTGNTEVVRTTIGPDVRPRTRRTLDERIHARWPSTFSMLARIVLSLSPRARLRRALVRRTVLSGWSAFSRGDFELMLTRYAPDCEHEEVPEMAGAGMRSIYRGHDGMRAQWADLRLGFERVDLTPREIVDAGDRIIVLGHQHTRGAGSGVELDGALGQVI
jgi:hypothetical protein